METFFGTILERDIDLLLLEEIFAAAAFRKFVLNSVHVARSEGHTLVSAARSAYNQDGETDVEMVVDLESHARVGVLIENKIDAVFQDDQCGRYHKRGKEGLSDGKWTEYWTCLCAPKVRCLPRSVGAEQVQVEGGWDGYLPLEDVAAFFDGQSTERHRFKAMIIRAAIEKQARRRFVPDEKATDFWTGYKELCRLEFPELHISRVGNEVSRSEPWPRFAEGQLPSGVVLEHKPYRGWVDLTIRNREQSELESRIGHDLPELGIFLARVGQRSTALRIQVPAIDYLQPFDAQADKVRFALNVVRRMLQIWLSVRTKLGF